MSGVFKVEIGFHYPEDCLDNETFSEQRFINKRHEMVLHIPPDSGDEMQTVSP